MKLNTESKCAYCNRTVGKNAHAVQCDGCRIWMHAKCAGMSPGLYAELKNCPLPGLKMLCKVCNAKFPEPNEDFNLDDSLLNATCVPAKPTSTSTPKGKKSYAEAVSNNSPNTTQNTKDHGRDSKNVQVHDIVQRINRLEKLIDNKATDAAEPSNAPATSLPNELKTPHTNMNPGKNRKQCLILMNLPESTADLAQDRVNHDVDMARDCFLKLLHRIRGGNERHTS